MTVMNRCVCTFSDDGLGRQRHDGARPFNLSPHLVVLIVTGNKSVFSSECNTGTSRRNHIHRRSSLEVVTVSSVNTLDKGGVVSFF